MRRQSSNAVYFIVVCAIIFLALFYISGGKKIAHSVFDSLFTPILKRVDDAGGQERSRAVLEEDNRRLLEENILLTQKLGAAQAALKDASIGNASGMRRLDARILWHSPFPGKQTVRLDKGTADGVEVDMPVVSLGGAFFGKVIAASQNNSDVVVVGDPSLRVSVDVAGSSGLLESSGEGLFVALVGRDARVEEGAIVRTAGRGDAISQGLLVGRVSHVDSRGADPFLGISVVPFADTFSESVVFIVL